MASYVNKKHRAFRDANTIDLAPRRSEGRMKTYPSATDARAWCDESEERRQHIIELIRKDISKGVSLGKFVPIDVIIDTLLANKNADIEKLKQQLDELQSLLDMYEKLDLTEDQKKQLGQMKQGMGKVSAGLGQLKDTTAADGRARASFKDGDKYKSGDESTAAKRKSVAYDDGGEAGPSTEPTAPAAEVEESTLRKINVESRTSSPRIDTKGDDVAALKNALAEKEAECNKYKKAANQAVGQLENIQDIIEERDRLRKQLEASKHELETLKKVVDKGEVSGQAQALEAQMEALREQGQLSPEQEVELMKQQLEAVKEDFAKLGALQAENNRLKKELEAVRGGKATSADTDGDIDAIKRKLQESEDDRDRLRARCQQLENELLQYGDLPGEVEILQERSRMLDSVVSERDSLYKRLKELEGLEDQVRELKKKADRADELEKQLAQLQQDLRRESSARRSSDDKIRDLASQGSDLKSKAMEAEVLKVERDKLQMRVNELADIEAQYLKLLDKTRGFDAMKSERDMYKQKYEELLGLECECDILKAHLENAKDIDKERDALQRQVRECECCIADQEDEIKRLITHIDRLTNGKDDHQERAKDLITNMRKQLEEKDQLISSSAEQLAHVQDQLKSTIEGVSSETARLKERIEELEGMLREKDELLRQLAEGKEREGEQKDDLISKMKAELEAARAENEKLQDIAEQMAAFTGDEHYKNLLRESKSAVEEVKEQLKHQYEEWDCAKRKMKEVDGSTSDLFSKYSEERRKSDALTTDIEKCQQRIRELEGQLKDAQKLIARLREQTGDLKQASADLEQSIVENRALRRHSAEVQDVAKEQIAELVEHLRKAKEKIAELEAENERLRKGLQDTSRELTQESPDSDSLQKLKKELEDVQLEKAKLEALIKALQEGVTSDDPQQELIRLKAEYAVLEEQLQKEIALRQAAENRVKELEEMVAKGSGGGDTQELERLRKELAEAKEQIERLEEALLSERKDSKLKVDRLNKELDDLAGTVKQETRRNSEEISDLQAELARVKAENQKLQSQLEAAGTTVETKVKSVDTSELEALKDERDKLLKQIEEQNKEITNLLEQMKSGADSAAVAEIEKQKKEKDALQELINKLEQQVKDLSTGQQVTDTSDLGMTDMVKKLTDQLEKEERNALEYQEKYQKCQQELEKLRNQTQDSMGIIDLDDGSAEKYEKCKQELEELKKQLQKSTGDKQESKGAEATDDSRAADEAKEWKEKYEKCQRELENLRKQFEAKTGEVIVVDSSETMLEKSVAANDTTAEDNVKRLSQELESEKDDVKKLKNQLLDCQKELKKLRGQLREEKGMRSRLSVSQSSAEKEIERLSQEFESATGKCKEELEELKKQLRQKDDLLKIEKNKAESAAQELQELQEAMAGDDQDGVMKTLQNTMASLKKGNEELQKEIAELRQKVDSLEEENMRLKNQLGGAVTEVERTRRVSKEWEKKYLASETSGDDEIQKLRDTIASLKEQYDRDINNLHNKHEEAVDKLQKQHEQAMRDLQEEYEKEINSLRDQLKSLQGRDVSVSRGSLTTKTMDVVDIKPKKCTCGRKLERILQKALNNGLEALDFDELKHLHTKLCDATSKLVNKGTTSNKASSSRQLSALESEKFLLLQKINTLEKDLKRKQKQTQLKVAQLQISVRIERERLEDLRRSLNEERGRNGELIHQIGVKDRTVANMQMERELLRKQTADHEQKLEDLILAIEEERTIMQALKQELKNEKSHVKKLKAALDEEKHKGRVKERELETLRIKYEKAINSEMMFKMELEQKPHEEMDVEDAGPSNREPQVEDGTLVPVPVAENMETTTFYTELTIRDAQNRQNFVHNTIMRRTDRGGASRRQSPRRPEEYER